MFCVDWTESGVRLSVNPPGLCISCIRSVFNFLSLLFAFIFSWCWVEVQITSCTPTDTQPVRQMRGRRLQGQIGSQRLTSSITADVFISTEKSSSGSKFCTVQNVLPLLIAVLVIFLPTLCFYTFLMDCPCSSVTQENYKLILSPETSTPFHSLWVNSGFVIFWRVCYDLLSCHSPLGWWDPLLIMKDVWLCLNLNEFAIKMVYCWLIFSIFVVHHQLPHDLRGKTSSYG